MRHEVEREAGVSVGSAAYLVAVQPHASIRHRTVEIDPVLRTPLVGHREVLPIPGHSVEGQPTAVRTMARIERPFDGPIVRQVQALPLLLTTVEDPASRDG